MSRTILVAALVVAVAACSESGSGTGPWRGQSPTAPTAPPTPAPTVALWPADYAAGVCLALARLDDAKNHLHQLVDAGTSFDAETAASEDGGIAQDTKAAVDALALADATFWKRGNPAVVYLRSAADYLRKARYLYPAGADHVDAATVKAADWYLARATYQMLRARGTMDVLAARYGLRCQ